MRIALIRHGETDWNVQGLLQGRSDIPLNGLGLAQAEDAARLLVGGGWERLYASPLGRARRTAEIIGRATGLGEPALVDGLVERSFGDLEGEPYWLPDGTRRPLDDPSIEPVAEVAARARTALDAIVHDGSGSDAIVVCHGTIIRMFLDTLMGGEAPRIANLGLSIVEHDGAADDDYRVVLANGYPLSPVSAAARAAALA